MFKSFFILFALFFVSINFSHAKTLNFTAGQWGKVLNKNEKDNGCLASIITETFKKENIDIDYTFIVWSGAYERTKAGKHDGSLFWYKSSEREKDFYYPKNHIRTDSLYFYQKMDHGSEIKAWKDLIGKRVVIHESYYYPKEFMKFVKKNNVKLIRLSDEEQMIKFTALGRGDIFISDENVFKRMMSDADTRNLSLFNKTNIPPLKMRGYLIFSKKRSSSKELVEKFDELYYSFMNSNLGRSLAKSCPGINSNPIK